MFIVRGVIVVKSRDLTLGFLNWLFNMELTRPAKKLKPADFYQSRN